MQIRFRYFLATAAVLGLLMGNIIPHIMFYDFFTRSAFSLLPWIVIGVAICYFGRNLLQTVLIGIAYTAFLAESFLFLGQLKFDSEFLKVIIFLLIILVAAVISGSIMGIAVFYLKKIANSIAASQLHVESKKKSVGKKSKK